MAIEFGRDFDPAYRRCVAVAPGIRRVVAENPSKYTAWGTGTYIVGTGEVAVIDPGPSLDSHVDALLDALSGETVTHILVTHTHGDHSPAAAALVEATGAPTYGYGPHPADAVTEVDTAGPEGAVEEHSDWDFVPDVAVRDGDVVSGADFEFECLHTPGHISNHVCFSERRRAALFSGDHVMGWSTTVISPPDGSIPDYMANLERLLHRDESVYYPTHGPPIASPRDHVAALIDHRHERERQILELLAQGPSRIEDLVASMYADVAAELHAPAARSVHAHLIGLAQADAVIERGGRWSLA